jgi:hypothetical protein
MGYSREGALSSVGEGWSGLINMLYDNKPKDVVVTDVKEKYGTLRFYVASCSEEFYKLIDEAEDKSATICEFCGEDGETRFDLGWYKTLCDKCYDNEIGYEEISEQ